MLTGIRDLDKLIITYLADKDISEFCKTCKYANQNVCDETFFRNLVINKYQNTLKFKDYVKTRSYKQYFFCIIYYIEKLKTKYKFNYLQEFQDKEGSPELEYLIRNLSLYNENKFRILIKALKFHHLPIVKYLIDQNSTEEKVRSALSNAIKYGNLSVIKYLVEDCVNFNPADKKTAITLAIKYGHLSLTKFFAEKINGGENRAPINTALINAVSYKQFEIVKYLVEIGAHIYNNHYVRSSKTNGIIFDSRNIDRGKKINEKTSLFLKSLIELSIAVGSLEITKYLQSLQ